MENKFNFKMTLFHCFQRVLLDGSLGFAAGVMLAASYWSLLAPAIEMASKSPFYGEQFAFVPVAIGFLLGAVFVYGSDLFMSHAGVDSPINLLLNKKDDEDTHELMNNSNGSTSVTIRKSKLIKQTTSIIYL